MLEDNVDKYKYLGMMIDCNLLFEKQIDNTHAKVESRLITFARIRKYIDPNVSLLRIDKQLCHLLILDVSYLKVVPKKSYNHCRIGQLN